MSAPRRMTLAVYTATGCRACEQGLLDLDGEVCELGRFAEPVFWPYVLGTPWEALDGDDRRVDVALFAGALRTEADAAAARRLRARSGRLVAVGACAALGGLPGLADLAAPAPANGAAPTAAPGDAATAGDAAPLAPRLAPATACLAQAVPVDHVVPGCPPTPSLLWAALLALAGEAAPAARLPYAAGRLPERVGEAIAAGVAPPRGTVFAGEKAVCASCSRVKQEKRFGACKRPYEAYEESGRCLLEQGLVCQGVATREGCGGLCTGVGVPCRGCFGKPPAVFDPGAKMIAAVASTFDAADAKEVAGLVDRFVDLAGTFYRYALPAQCALWEGPAAAADEGCDGCRR